MSVSVSSEWSERDSAMWRWVFTLLVLCATLTRADTDKRAEMSPVPFVLGSRYGRSPPRMLAPRNDRYTQQFFMGSRYGKRSELLPGAGALHALSAVPALHAPDAGSGPAAALLCEYTGLYSMYRCVRPPRASYENRRGDDDGPAGDEE